MYDVCICLMHMFDVYMYDVYVRHIYEYMSRLHHIYNT